MSYKRKIPVFIVVLYTYVMAANNKIVIFLLLYRKDVRLPQQLQRAMAAEAEASREARAKVIIIYFS